MWLWRSCNLEDASRKTRLKFELQFRYRYKMSCFSFFAGYMTKDEADRVITAAEKVGTFLIRFSSSEADKGSFAVCLKTDTGAEHKLLEVIN